MLRGGEEKGAVEKVGGGKEGSERCWSLPRIRLRAGGESPHQTIISKTNRDPP